jgi:apolipoprotein N-acyltransferase
MIAADEFGGFIGVIVGLLVLVLAIMWLIFPVLVLSKFNELLKSQREIRAALLSANAARSEIAKALQWMVNNWKQRSSKPPDQPPV